jgi:hypothetical protein
MATTKKSGSEGFYWFIGIVENINDPMQLGRLQVRAYNWHTQDKNMLSTNMLMWAWIVQPVNGGTLYPAQNQGITQNGGIGFSPTGILMGTTVFGWFADGREAQMPIILGSIPAMTDGNSDVSQLATGTNTIQNDLVGPEPSSAYQAKYPYNKVQTTQSGHVIEIDDTPSHERIRIYHKEGTYTEINQDGRKVDKCVDQSFEIVVKDKTVYVKGNLNVTVIGSANITIEQDADIEVGGELGIHSKGPMSISTDGQMSINSSGPMSISSDIQLNLFAPIITENTIPPVQQSSDIDESVTE